MCEVFRVLNKNKKKNDLIHKEQGDCIKRKETIRRLINAEREEEEEGKAIPVTDCEGP
jgi:hypothetical protein